MSRRRSNTGITNLLSDIVDDIKDFVDDEIIDRGRDSERDLRRASRNWTDSDDDRPRRSATGTSDSDLDDLRATVRALSRKVDSLATGRGSEDSGDRPPIANYDNLTAAQITDRLSTLSQSELATVDAYERANANRVTITGRLDSLRAQQPWDGYDEQTVEEVRKELMKADEAALRAVRTYESRHKDRQGVLHAVDSALSSS